MYHLKKVDIIKNKVGDSIQVRHTLIFIAVATPLQFSSRRVFTPHLICMCYCITRMAKSVIVFILYIIICRQ